MTTVVILNYNGAKWLEDLLVILSGEKCKVIVADNRSEDESFQVFDKLTKNVKNYEDFRWIQFNRNLGFAQGNNRAIAKADTESVLLLNNDMFPKEGFLEKMESAQTEEYPIVGAKLIFGETKKQEVPYEMGTFIFSAKKGLVQHAGIDYYAGEGYPFEMGRNMVQNDPRVIKSREVPSVTGACMLIRRNVFLGLEGFNQKFKNGWEDTDLCLRAREKGYKCWYQSDAELMHFCSSSKGRFANETRNKQYWAKIWHKDNRLNKALNR